MTRVGMEGEAMLAERVQAEVEKKPAEAGF
jgi:hypothetical protein